ncbi:MAG: RDD family protein [Novosphingobium sp.]
MVTPEGIALPIILASRGSRLGALLIDLGVIGLLIVGTTLALLSIAGGTAALLARAGEATAIGHAIQFLMILWLTAMFLLRNAYFLYFELGPRGATPGKRLTGIRIAARDGGRLSAEMVIARNLLRDVELFLPIMFVSSLSGEGTGPAGLAAAAWFVIFAGMPLFNRDRLRAGDIVAGSWVVESPSRRLEPALSAVGPSGFVFSDLELSAYGEYELQMLERLLRERRTEAIATVHVTIAQKIGRDPIDGEAAAFLDAYYRQLRARLEAGMRMGRRKRDKYARFDDHG